MNVEVVNHISFKEVSDSKARSVATRNGHRAIKSRAGESVDNHGGYMLVDAATNSIVAGVRFDLSAEEVVEYFK